MSLYILHFDWLLQNVRGAAAPTPTAFLSRRRFCNGKVRSDGFPPAAPLLAPAAFLLVLSRSY